MGFSQAPGLPYSKLGISEDGDAASRAISKGKYVIWKGKNYFAKTDILQGETFVEDTNLTEIPDGALNGIADALNASMQHGSVDNSGSSGLYHVVFPVPFSSVPAVVAVAHNFSSDGTAPSRTLSIRDVSQNGFYIAVYVANSGDRSSMGFDWIAMA